MRLIKCLSEQIEDEVDGVCEYAKCALEYRYSHPQLAEVYYKLATTEYGHAVALHEQVVKVIEEVKKERREEPPQFMKDKWEKAHKKIIDKMADAKLYLSMYK